MAGRDTLTRTLRFGALAALTCAAAAALTLTAACASSGSTRRGGVPVGTAQPDQYLFDRGTAALNDKKWLSAREFFRQLEDNYSQSPLRPDAKLAIGDTYLGEGSSDSLVLAINEFQEFLTYYPTSPRADYAQYQIGVAHVRQMRNPERDQTETRDAIRELQAFVIRYPNSKLMPDARSRLREAKDRLSMSDYLVGFFYFRNHWYPAAIDRFITVIKDDPEFSGRDSLYFYLGESLIKMNRSAEALPYYEKLVSEFEQSDHLRDARKRIEELKAQQAAKAPVN
jgi:outer membrane protein assembly factor BamD